MAKVRQVRGPGTRYGCRTAYSAGTSQFCTIGPEPGLTDNVSPLVVRLANRFGTWLTPFPLGSLSGEIFQQTTLTSYCRQQSVGGAH